MRRGWGLLCAAPPASHRALGGVPPASPRGWRLQEIKCFNPACVCHWGGDTGPRAPGLCGVGGGDGAPQLFLPLPIGTGCLICINLHRSSLGRPAGGSPLPSLGLFPGTGAIPGLQPPLPLASPGGDTARAGREFTAPGGGSASPQRVPGSSRSPPTPSGPPHPLPSAAALTHPIGTGAGKKKSGKLLARSPPHWCHPHGHQSPPGTTPCPGKAPPRWDRLRSAAMGREGAEGPVLGSTARTAAVNVNVFIRTRLKEDPSRFPPGIA